MKSTSRLKSIKFGLVLSMSVIVGCTAAQPKDETSEPSTSAPSFQSSMASTALRDPGSQINTSHGLSGTSLQISLNSEANTYAAGADLPTTGGFNYRDIPDTRVDFDGTAGVACKFAPRPGSNCGLVQTTLAARIADCAAVNPTTSTWSGAVRCNGGEGNWKLVTRAAANKEVWQDQRTGLLWSTKVYSGFNWCQATGNTQLAPLIFSGSYHSSQGTPIVGNGTVSSLASGSASVYEIITITFTSATTYTVSGTAGAGGCQTGSASGSLTTSAGSAVTFSSANKCSFTITQGSTNFSANDIISLTSHANGTYSCLAGASSGNQPASPLSACAEAPGLSPVATENWVTGAYMDEKGNLGKNSAPSVRWRLPTLQDYKLATINGLVYVMPDMGPEGSYRPDPDASAGGAPGQEEWTATSNSYLSNAWKINSIDGTEMSTAGKNQTTSGGMFGALYSARCVGR